MLLDFPSCDLNYGRSYTWNIQSLKHTSFYTSVFKKWNCSNEQKKPSFDVFHKWNFFSNEIHNLKNSVLLAQQFYPVKWLTESQNKLILRTGNKNAIYGNTLWLFSWYENCMLKRCLAEMCSWSAYEQWFILKVCIWKPAGSPLE